MSKEINFCWLILHLVNKCVKLIVTLKYSCIEYIKHGNTQTTTGPVSSQNGSIGVRKLSLADQSLQLVLKRNGDKLVMLNLFMTLLQPVKSQRTGLHS